ncbi:S-adenosyl-L-methionine-dependent methyltransferase [Dichotomopilus funicola]|uniref:S-adenosyl-L-methionine-dependent methyltransferase n=1 Tax=Dichotomopilus funicola TaxID=1934379 RepID=A0AAN6ZJ14_9PEZI|nr:S-adenosyl-L-methionine-dependent methyltransferase [Dichotomopilus funicola]
MSSTPNMATAEHFNKTAENYEAITGGGPQSKILDNACGTGIVTDIIIQSGIQPSPEIHAVDFAEGMVSVAKGRFSSHSNVHAAVMPGEDLAFPDDTFTHSITNLGLMFFADADKGAKEIARTLHPDRVAVITGWAKQAPFKLIQEIHNQIRPDGPPFKLPVPEIWFDPEHTKALLTGAGLDVHMGAETTDGVADILTRFSGRAFATYSEEEKEKAAGLIKRIVQERAVPFTRPSGSGVGIKVTGTIFVVWRRSEGVPAV